MYLLACLVVMLLVAMEWLGTFYRAAFGTADDIRSSERSVLGITVVGLSPAGLMFMPVAASTLEALRFLNGEAAALNAEIVSVAAASFGSLVLLIVTVAQVIWYWRKLDFCFAAKLAVLIAAFGLALVVNTSDLIFAK